MQQILVMCSSYQIMLFCDFFQRKKNTVSQRNCLIYLNKRSSCQCDRNKCHKKSPRVSTGVDNTMYKLETFQQGLCLYFFLWVTKSIFSTDSDKAIQVDGVNNFLQNFNNRNQTRICFISTMIFSCLLLEISNLEKKNNSLICNYDTRNIWNTFSYIWV